jgi:phage tail protein X
MVEGKAPIIEGGPEPAPQPPQEIPPGYPAPEKVGRIYVSTQGDWWDLIAMRVYGMKRGNEHLMYRLLEANYSLREVSNFPAGVPVIVPTVDVATEIPLVPWTSATFIPAP